MLRREKTSAARNWEGGTKQNGTNRQSSRCVDKQFAKAVVEREDGGHRAKQD